MSRTAEEPKAGGAGRSIDEIALIDEIARDIRARPEVYREAGLRLEQEYAKKTLAKRLRHDLRERTDGLLRQTYLDTAGVPGRRWTRRSQGMPWENKGFKVRLAMEDSLKDWTKTSHLPTASNAVFVCFLTAIILDEEAPEYASGLTAILRGWEWRVPEAAWYNVPFDGPRYAKELRAVWGSRCYVWEHTSDDRRGQWLGLVKAAWARVKPQPAGVAARTNLPGEWRRGRRWRTIRHAICAVAVSAALIAGMEYAIYRVPWLWLRDHPNSYSLQVLAWAFILFLMGGLFVRRWRYRLWAGGLVALAAMIVPLLGGPSGSATTTRP